MIKAIFFDVDGTLFSFKTHQIPDSALTALHQLQERGIKTFICTGRYPSDINDLFTPELRRLFTGFIALNGQYCYTSDGILLHEQPIDKSDLLTLVDFIKDKDIACGFMELDYYYYNRVNNAIHQLNQFLGDTVIMRPIDTTERVKTHKTYQLNLFLPEESEHIVTDHLPHCKPVRWCPYFTDLIPADGGKAVGIKHVLAHYGIDVSESMSFGDGGNDIEMLHFTNIGVAMGNAGEKVKAAADYVTSDVDDDGVLKALQHFGVL